MMHYGSSNEDDRSGSESGGSSDGVFARKEARREIRERDAIR